MSLREDRTSVALIPDVVLRKPCADGEVFISWKMECRNVDSLQPSIRLYKQDQVVRLVGSNVLLTAIKTLLQPSQYCIADSIVCVVNAPS